MKFSDYRFDQEIQASLEELKFNEPTEIQAKAIPIVMAGQDLAGLAQTGTGKTAAFLLPLMQRILMARKATHAVPNGAEAAPVELDADQDSSPQVKPFESWKKGQFILVLVPTRELAEQVQQNCLSLGSKANLKSAVIYGGSSYDRQKDALKADPEFVIATPGRLIDLYKEHIVDLKQVRAVVFDEADRMFDMGFKDDMKFILRRLPPERQFLVFSATLNFEVLHSAYEFGAQPVEVNVSKDKATADHVTDSIFHVGSDEKPKYLLSLIKLHQPKQAIVFSNFKRDVERIALFLSRNDYPAAAISSLLSQAQRNRVMEQFKNESATNILVATDVAARGLDIAGVDLVINYDLPDDPENYVHRIGRTGRAGKEGQAFSLVSERDVESLPRIEDYVHRKLDIGWLESDQLLENFKPLPRESFGGPASKGKSSSYRNKESGANRTGRTQRKGPRRDQHDPKKSSTKKAGAGGYQKASSGTGERQRDEGGRNDRNIRTKSHQRRQPINRPLSPMREANRSVAKPNSAVVNPKAAGFGARVKGFFKKILGGGAT